MQGEADMDANKSGRFKPDAVLRKVFPGLEGDALIETLFMSRIRSFPENTVIVREGEEGDVFYILGEGTVVITKETIDGSERILREVGPGGYFGEMALIANTPR